ncbi:MAG: 16S rRNA processing protein RimM [Chloroflexi bacterium]|nr:16S rRNA processing protein RimM [Chloroflexota bacterium]
MGRIKGAWGIHGDVKIDLLSDAPDRFEPGNIVHVKNKSTRVQRSRPIRGGMVVKLDIVNDRNQAALLRGQEITVKPEQVSPPPQGSYYHFQVLGLDVLSQEGENLGRVREIIETGANDVYVVHLEGRRDVLIPALEDVILDVDLERGSMTVRLPDGLI